MPQCANPECPNAAMSTWTMKSHWVQVHEVEYSGVREGEGVVQHQFAAVTCSKRCAVAVLTAALPAEQAAQQAAQEGMQRLFPPKSPTV